MREIFTDKKFISSKILIVSKIFLIISLLVFFLPLMILPFFNHSFTDDYFCGYRLHLYGFADYQAAIYKNWGGRFAATFAGSLFVYNDFLYSHYYLHSLLLLVFNFISFYFLITAISKYILKEKWLWLKKVLLTFIFLSLEICSIPQAAMFIFWFSSAITYQLPIILVQTELILFIILFNSNNKVSRNISVIILPFLIFIIVGFNELFIVVQLFLFAILFYLSAYKKISKIFISTIVFVFIISAALTIFAPGNAERRIGIEPKPIPVAMIVIGYHSLETLWSIFKNPLTWFIAAITFMYAQQRREIWHHNLYVKKIVRNKLLLPFAIILFLIASIGLPVAALKGGIIPERYLNGVAYFTLLLLLAYVFILGINSSVFIFSFSNASKNILIYFFLGAGILCNTYITDAYKSLIIAPIYNSILTERQATLKQAAKSNKIATVKTYDFAVQE